MPKVKISEYSATANSNTDVASINIDEGCAPSGINNAIRAVMGHLKDFQQGTNGDPFNGPVNGTLGATTASTASVTTLTTSSTVTHNGGTANGVAYLNGSKVLTTGSALVFDGSNLGVGNAPYVWLSSFRSLDVGSTASFAYFNSGSYVYNNAYYNTSSNLVYKTTGYAQSYIQNSTGQHVWQIAASGTAGNAITFTQAMTLDASGNLLVGATSAFTTGAVNATQISSSGVVGISTASDAPLYISRRTTDGAVVVIRRDTTQVGSISVTTTATAYNTSSDYRLKDVTGPVTGAKDFIMALQPKQGTWKVDGSKFVGFLAHEFQEVSPSSVTGEKDAVDADGKPIMQAMQASSAEVMANLVAHIQNLETRLAALEGA